LNRLLPWLVLLLAALALFYFLGRGCAGAKSRTAGDKQEETIMEAESPEKTGDTTRQAARPASSVVTPGSSVPIASAETFISKIRQAFAEGKEDPNMAFILDQGTFQGKSAILTREAEKELEHFATVLKEYPRSEIRIEAHTDNSGNADINMQLSTQQALAVMTYLRDRGVALNRMSTKGRGQTKPLVPNDTDAAREQNRRVEIYVVKKNG
jgi:outer membrane protein OmpA-like peptidoglycan-associated protein